MSCVHAAGLGFHPIAPYIFNPLPDALYFEYRIPHTDTAARTQTATS